MQIVINDANILIDLIKLDLFNEFKQLNLDLYSTDFVIEELNPNQRQLINRLSKSNDFSIIKTTSSEDLYGINYLLENSSGLSFEDCSVWYYAKKLNGILLTGDRKLRKLAQNNDVEVKGVLFIFDQLLEKNIISYDIAYYKMNELLDINQRLPRDEIEKRLHKWKKNK